MHVLDQPRSRKLALGTPLLGEKGRALVEERVEIFEAADEEGNADIVKRKLGRLPG
jgi:hypothetical protein